MLKMQHFINCIDNSSVRPLIFNNGCVCKGGGGGFGEWEVGKRVCLETKKYLQQNKTDVQNKKPCIKW